MKKFGLMAAIFAVAMFVAAGSAFALPWVVSPYSPAGGTIVFGVTNVVGVQEISDPETGQQIEGIYGAGFMTSASGVWFDADLYTWDSYSATGDASNDGGAKGWWDSFAVNINQEGYYWDLVAGGGTINDPIISASYGGGYGVIDNSVLPGVTFVFGGEDYANGTLESFTNAPTAPILLQMAGGNDLLPYYVSVVLDTQTSPNHDTNYPSYGSFHVEPIPEPATVLLMGAGLGLLGLGALRRKKLGKDA